jgi:hypothetical protein
MNANAISLSKAQAELRRLEGLRRVALVQVKECEQKMKACVAAIDIILNMPPQTAKTDQNASRGQL